MVAGVGGGRPPKIDAGAPAGTLPLAYLFGIVIGCPWGVRFLIPLQGSSAIVTHVIVHRQCPLLPSASLYRPYPPFG